jgi:nucleoside-diphosphate-sugar epimerase
VSRRAAKRGDRILVTGAAGRIGSSLCQSLSQLGYRVRAIVLPDDPGAARLAGLDVEMVQADLRDAGAVRAASSDVQGVCHLAAVMDSHGGALKPADLWAANVDTTLNVLEAARHEGVVAFVFASTDATYPASRPLFLPIPETHPQNPVSMYGLTKVAGEALCRSYFTEWGLPTRILRFGNVATPEERATGASFTLTAHVERFKAAKRNHDNYLWINLLGHERPWEGLRVVGGDEDQLVALVGPDGRPWQSHYTDVRDSVAGIVLALESEAAVGEAFNIVGPAPTTWVEAVKYLSLHRGVPWRTATVPIRQATEISTAKARGVLGYVPKYDFYRAVDDGHAILKRADPDAIGSPPSPR